MTRPFDRYAFVAGCLDALEQGEQAPAAARELVARTVRIPAASAMSSRWVSRFTSMPPSASTGLLTAKPTCHRCS